MAYKETKTGLCVDGVFYAVGMTVESVGQSEYRGLVGIITEIRTGSDKDTENEGPDIYCAFNEPEDPESVRQLEETFSELYNEPKTIDDIILDSVIMSPEMIRPV